MLWLRRKEVSTDVSLVCVLCIHNVYTVMLKARLPEPLPQRRGAREVQVDEGLVVVAQEVIGRARRRFAEVVVPHDEDAKNVVVVQQLVHE